MKHLQHQPQIRPAQIPGEEWSLQALLILAEGCNSFIHFFVETGRVEFSPTIGCVWTGTLSYHFLKLK